MERIPHQILNNPGANIETTNLIQMTLAGTSGLDMEEWIAQYASDFRLLVEEHPDLVSEFVTEPEKTIDTIRNSLKKLH